MKINLTVGTIWQDTRNQKHFELTAINKETGKIQLSSAGNEQSFTCMTEASLHKHYKLIAMNMKEFRPETIQTVTTEAKDEIISEHIETKSKKETKTYIPTKLFTDKNDAIAKIHFEDGRVLSANEYVALHGKNGKDISGLTIHWIEKVKMAQEWLVQDKAQIVYVK